MIRTWIKLGVFVLLSTGLLAQEPADYTKPVAGIIPLEPGRVGQIALLLDEKPAGFGSPVSDRKVWDKLWASGKYASVLKQAEGMLTKPFPVFDTELYMGIFTKGDSQSGKDMLNERLRWLIVLCWAECLENKGKYIPKLELVIGELLKQKTWVNPRNYSEKTFSGLVELSTASYAHNLAQAFYLLGDKLNTQTRKDILESLHARAFNPVLATLEGKDRNHSWLTVTNNWNAVCLSGITGAALTVLSDKTERAKFVAIAERYSQNFIAGFHNDGYCTEGIGYYNYGFGRFISLRENVLKATNGKIDFFSNDKIKNIAGFLPNMEMINGTYPAIADCPADPKPAKNILYYVSHNLGMGLSQYDSISLLGARSDLVADVLYVFPNSASMARPAAGSSNRYGGIRSYFDAAGILTVRPAANSKAKLAAVFKGGKNNEHHNHNDLGSYTIAVGDQVLMGDPGLIPYTAKTFGPNRYDYKTLSSYGHPVPLIAGEKQRSGNQAQAKILRADFTDAEDHFEMDITSAYQVDGLRSLIRKFDYKRLGDANLDVTDAFVFDTARPFETAIITRAAWKQNEKGQIILEGKNNKLMASITAPEGGFTIKEEKISEENGLAYTRLGIQLNKPVKSGSVTVSYKQL
ncbi:heparinase II/III family protein [Dyadobacter psychrotolerans]|uniref:Heparinase n=1 Tax=Dyadobacter psychrotolerans TaxID=2541721 RepID=A0A4V2Z413_9BACT|nr:heparinase II/III family protein [Dyadobacter psychrotolerans]TDE14858.1 hypothetical protein E0F88_16905 [Dyadobacter psychrotolerans]